LTWYDITFLCQNATSLSVLFIVGPKNVPICWPRHMLSPGESRYADKTDRRTDAMPLGFPLDVASIIKT